MKSWSHEDEIVLLKAVAKNKPIGPHKTSNINTIVKTINAVLSTAVSKKDVTERLETLYDLQGLEDLENASEESALGDDNVDKSDVEGDEEGEDNTEDEKQELKRTVLTRSSTRRKSSEPESGDDEKTVKVRKSTRNKSSVSTPARSTEPEPTTKEDQEEFKSDPEEDTANNNTGDPDSEESKESNEDSSSESEEVSEPDKPSRKRTRSTALTPSMKLLKQNASATPSSSRRSTRFGPVVEATPSKPATRTSSRKSTSKPLVAVLSTPGNNNVVSTPSNNRRRSMRKK